MFLCIVVPDFNSKPKYFQGVKKINDGLFESY